MPVRTIQETTDFINTGTVEPINPVPSDVLRKNISKVLLIDIPVMNEVDSPEKDPLNAYWKAEMLLTDPAYIAHMSARKYSRGLLTIGKALEEQGIASKYLSVNDLSLEELDNAINWADMVGITGSCTSFYPVMKALSERIKSRKPESLVVFGGRHAGMIDKEFLKRTPAADIVVRGEGEETILKILDDSQRLVDINNLSYRSDDNQIVATPDTGPLAPGQILAPAYNLLPHKLQEYSFKLESSRGCPGNCAFCVDGSFFKGKPRMLEIDAVLRELLFLKEHLEPGTHLHFIDSIFTLKQANLESLLQSFIREGLNEQFSFSCDIRAGFKNKKLIKLMEEAGFKHVLMGLEDPNDQVLATVNKGVNIKQDIETAKAFKSMSKIKVTGYWIVGLPGSTHQSLHMTIQTAKELIRDEILDIIDCAMFVPYPGTDVYNKPEKYGLTIIEKEWGPKYLRCQFQQAIYRYQNGLSETQVANYFNLLVNTLLQEYLDKLDISLKELLEF